MDIQWKIFKFKFNKKYNSEKEEQRKLNFLKSLQFIESHNKMKKNSENIYHEVAINEFADWSPEEYEDLLTTDPLSSSEILNNFVNKTTLMSEPSLPPAFDWRQHNKVTPVENQGHCGSCWAFAATASIESVYAIKYNQSIRLSEQQLLDCSKNNGCKGGNVGRAFLYVQQYGISKDIDYPYRIKRENCKNMTGKSLIKIKGYKLFHRSSDQQIMTIIRNSGPIAVNIDGSGNDFVFYRGGIIRTGNKTMNHYVTAIGWHPDYWIIKNSWGTHWGEGGYAKIARGNNVRGFNQWLFLPIF